MKMGVLLTILSLFSCQNSSKEMEIINQFIQIVKTNDDALGRLKDEKNLKLTTPTETSNHDFERGLSLIIESISDQLQSCDSNNESLSILDIENARINKSFNEKLDVPAYGRAYIVYCNNKIITRILLVDNKIAAFSVINKSGKSVFLIL